jgi:hypothetical protein
VKTAALRLQVKPKHVAWVPILQPSMLFVGSASTYSSLEPDRRSNMYM